MKKIGFVFAAASVAMWAPNATAQTTLEVSYAWPGHEAFHVPVAEAFMQQNPDVIIEFRAAAKNYDEAVQTLIRQSFADQEPDIHFVGFHLMRQLTQRNLAQPLDAMMANVDMKSLGYDEKVLELGQLGGVQYGLPFTMSTPIVFYNADLVARAGGDPDELPTDWDGFIELAGKIGALGDDIGGMYYVVGGSDWMAQNLIRNFGGQLMTPDGQDIAFDNDIGVSAFGLFQRFLSEGGMPVIETPAARQLMVAGKLGMFLNSTSMVGGFERDVGDSFDFRTAVMPLSRSDSKVATGGMSGVIVTDDPAKQDAAWRYLLFASGPEAQDIVVRNSGYMPTNNLALGSDYLGSFYEQNPNWRTSVQQLPLAAEWFSWPGENGVEIAQKVKNTLGALIHEPTAPEQVVEDLSEEVRELLPN